MNTLVRFLIPAVMLCCVMQLSAQDDYQTKIKDLEAQRELVVKQEKEALKAEITRIDGRLEAGEISLEEAQGLKEAAAENGEEQIDAKQATELDELKNQIAAMQEKIASLGRK